MDVAVSVFVIAGAAIGSFAIRTHHLLDFLDRFDANSMRSGIEEDALSDDPLLTERSHGLRPSHEGSRFFGS
jgi:hypothetical protein